MNWIYEGLSEAGEPNGDMEVTGKYERPEHNTAEKQDEKEDTAAGHNGISDGEEEVLGENGEFIASLNNICNPTMIMNEIKFAM